MFAIFSWVNIMLCVVCMCESVAKAKQSEVLWSICASSSWFRLLLLCVQWFLFGMKKNRLIEIGECVRGENSSKKQSNELAGFLHFREIFDMWKKNKYIEKRENVYSFYRRRCLLLLLRKGTNNFLKPVTNGISRSCWMQQWNLES